MPGLVFRAILKIYLLVSARMGALGMRMVFPGLASHIHVALDTRLPRQLLLHCSTSCIPAVVPRTVLGRPYTPPAQHQTTCIYKKLTVQTFAKSADFSSSEAHLCNLPETIDPRIRAKGRMCGGLLQDRTRQESSIERHTMCLSES